MEDGRALPATANDVRALVTVETTREKLRLWGLSPEQISAIEQNEKPDDHLTIYSPISGIVIHKNAVEGMYVDTGIFVEFDETRLEECEDLGMAMAAGLEAGIF